jgi:septin 2
MSKQQPTQFVNPETSTYVGLANFPNEAQKKKKKREKPQ